MPEKKEREYGENFSMPDVRALNRLVGWLVTSESARLSQVLVVEVSTDWQTKVRIDGSLLFKYRETTVP